MTTIHETIHHHAGQAKAASVTLAHASSEKKAAALHAMADSLVRHRNDILAANQQDMVAGQAKGLTPALLDRLKLDDSRLESITKSLHAIAEQSDPIGTVLEAWQRPNGLAIEKVRVPLGVIGIIYESRPNVTADAVALCLKSGNAAVLRSGSESLRSSLALMRALQASLSDHNLPREAFYLIDTPNRDAVGAMLSAVDSIDVIIPRGGRSLIERVAQESKIPVIKHLDGLCHTYIDSAADPSKALHVTVNAKMRRVGICGATETILVHEEYGKAALLELIHALIDKGCEVRGDKGIQGLHGAVIPADEVDWHTEYLAPIVSIKRVADVREAVHHINRYGSHHTDAIITEDAAAAQYFLTHVDSGIVMHNTSTQFADGGEFGFGAEIGISTGKLHARGPVGAEHLTTIQYRVRSDGAVRP